MTDLLCLKSLWAKPISDWAKKMWGSGQLGVVFSLVKLSNGFVLRGKIWILFKGLILVAFLSSFIRSQRPKLIRYLLHYI